MRLAPCIGTVVAIVAISLTTAAIAHADSPPIVLSAQPDSVTLAQGEAAQVLVVARISITTVNEISLSAFSDADFKVAISEPARIQHPLRGDHAWMVTVTNQKVGLTSGKVYLRSDYKTVADDGESEPGVVTTVLDVQERLTDAVDKVISARIESGLDTVMDTQSRELYLIISNISNVPVTVTHIQPVPIPLFSVSVMSLGATGVRLEPQQSNPFTMTLKANDAVQSGKHILVARVDAEWDKAGQRVDGSLVLDKEFQAGVFGEAIILQVTAIPATMLLPGFIALTLLAVLYKRVWPKSPDAAWELNFAKPEFWLFAILISLLTITLYPWITGPLMAAILQRPNTSRYFVQAYGFNDIVLLWSGAFILGFILWILAIVFRQVLKPLYNLTRFRLFIPLEGDAPREVLEKIKNRRVQIDKLKAYNKTPAPAGNPLLFELGRKDGKILIARRIKVVWPQDADHTLQKEYDAKKEYPRDQIKLLLGWCREGKIGLNWDLREKPGLVDETGLLLIPDHDPFIDAT